MTTILQMLMIRLEETEYGVAWVLGDKSGLPDADGDIKGIKRPSLIIVEK